MKHVWIVWFSVWLGVVWPCLNNFWHSSASFGSAGSPFSCFLKLAWQLARNTVQTEPRPNMSEQIHFIIARLERSWEQEHGAAYYNGTCTKHCKSLTQILVVLLPVGWWHHFYLPKVVGLSQGRQLFALLLIIVQVHAPLLQMRDTSRYCLDVCVFFYWVPFFSLLW